MHRLRYLWPQRWWRLGLAFLLVVASFTSRSDAEPEEEFFESKIRPILVERCESCHSTRQGKTHGGLALDSRQGWMKGGDSGAALVPGKVEESLFIKAISYENDLLKMPPQEAGGKLPEAEIALLTEWVRRGATDPRTESARRGGLTEQELRDWWSFQPLKPVTVPEYPISNRTRNPVDHFIQNRLELAGLMSSPEADRRTFIRRLTYDLTGLPPTLQEVDAFLADASSTAYETLVDRLLRSPRYGERWGRHWLDLVRYADTAGENTDHPIPDAWRYRDWVIEAFNRDLPYDEFIREQIAGDLVHANDTADRYAAGVIGTGFLAIARRFDHDSDKHMHLTFEDAIDTLGKSVLGLSIACARCHDHKYDPISTRDYFALYGIFNSTRFAFPGCEAKQQPRDMIPLLPPSEWTRTVAPYDQKLASLDLQIKQAAEAQVSLANEFKGTAAATSLPLARGLISDGGSQPLESTTGQGLNAIDVKIGQTILLTIDPQTNYGADTTLVEWEIDEIGGPQRKWNLSQDVTSDFLAANPHADRRGNSAVWLFLDARSGLSLLPEPVRDLMGKPGLNVWRNGDNPAVFVNSTKDPISVWTTLPPQSVFVHPASDGAVAIAWVSPIDGQIRIGGRITDAHPGGPNGIGWSLQLISGDSSAGLKRLAEISSQRTQLLAARTDLVAQAPLREVAYAVTEGTPANARLHLRGDPEKLGDEVPRRWLELFGGEPVPADAGSGRLELARWLTDRSNPLTARVMVNRIWQYHFGKGLVQTPNDFGTRGQQPTHPELLDWLGQEFASSGWSIKSMHRLIVLSATYRQSSTGAPPELHDKGMTVDPTNNLYWRFDRRRMSAEELRDSLLMASGQLQLSSRGPYSLPPSTNWSYSQHVPFAGVPETNHRTIYQMTLRNRRPPFMSLFDGADPNATTPQRQVTTVPTQSLYFLNDPFFHGQAEAVAARIEQQPDTTAQLNELFQIIFQRLPSDRERDAVISFQTTYAPAIATLPTTERSRAILSASARILLSSNQFLYVD